MDILFSREGVRGTWAVLTGEYVNSGKENMQI